MSTSFPSFHEFPNPGADGVARIDKDAEAEFEDAMEYADKNLNIHSIAQNALKKDENYVQVVWGDRKAYFKKADYQQIQDFHNIFQEFVKEPEEAYEPPARPNLAPLIITQSYHAGIPTFERISSTGEPLPPIPETPVEGAVKIREPTKEEREDMEFLSARKEELEQMINDFPDVTNLVKDWESIQDNLQPLEETMNKAQTYSASTQDDAPKELRDLAKETIKLHDEFQMALLKKINKELEAILDAGDISTESKAPIESFTKDIDNMVTKAFTGAHSEAEWDLWQTAKDNLEKVKPYFEEEPYFLRETLETGGPESPQDIEGEIPPPPIVEPLTIPDDMDAGNIATYNPSDLPSPPPSPIPPPPPLTPSTPPPPPPTS